MQIFRTGLSQLVDAGLWIVATALLVTVAHAHDDDGVDHVAEDEKAAELAQNYAPFEVDPATIFVPVQEDFDLYGSWSPVIDWPHIPVSAANLPDGRILTWASNQPDAFPGGTEYTYATVWDPADNSFLDVPHNAHDMFCSHQVVLQDGRVFVAGGRNHVQTTSVFDSATNTWTMIEPMNRGRWYPSSVYQSDGSVFIAVGSSGGQYPEVWNYGEGWRLLTGIDLSDPILNYSGHYEQNWWPFLSVTPTGDVLHYGPTPVMHSMNSAGTGTIEVLGTVTEDWYPKHGGTVVYDEGKIIVAGGAKSGSDLSSSRKALIIDINGPTPVVTPIADMANERKFQNAITLPNGEVIIIGGNTSGEKFDDAGTVLTAEIWNPTTGLWRETAPMSEPRNYHSIALLMVDARVLSGGGGLCGGCAANHQDAQVFSPAYLFNDDGTLATRPVITSAPAAVNNGWTYPVAATPGLQEFNLVKMSSTTHAVNTDMRFLRTSFTEDSAGLYSLTFHSNENVLTPGYYMLFALDAQGVPSIAAVIQVNAGVSPPNYPPTLALDDQISGEGEVINVQVSYNDIDGDSLNFSATGLPTGLSIDAITGVITGTPTSFGGHSVTVSAQDPTGAIGSAQFDWEVILPGGGSGQILAEYWTNISGNDISLLTGSLDYPDNPSATEYLTSFESPTNWNNNYGTRVRAYLHPPVSGDYQFWIATDDSGELWLSSDETPDNAVRIAHVPGWSASRQWDKFTEQQSVMIPLEEGKKYYIEVLQKEGGGGDNMAVAWQFSGSSRSVIFGLYLSEYGVIPNEDPSVVNPGAQVTVVGDFVSISLVASDPDGDTVTFSATGLPPGITLDTVSGVIDGTATTAGSYNTVITVDDGMGASANTVFNWQVNLPPVNQVPTIDNPGDQLDTVGDVIVLDLDASDPDADTLTWSAGGLPTGLTIDTSSGQITGTATVIGNFIATITVDDGQGANGNVVFNWQIDDIPNQNPTLTTPGDQSSPLGEIVSLILLFDDVDGDTLSFSASGLPNGLGIDPVSGEIFGTLSAVPITYNVTVTADDGNGGSAQAMFNWEVTDPSAALALSQGVVSNVSSDWQTVQLPKMYSDMVVIATPQYDVSGMPAVTRVRNTTAVSFELKVQNPAGNALSGYSVHYLVMEAGVYNQATHGINLEAVKFESTITDENNSWAGEFRAYNNSYLNPVVLGQVMSENDTNWSVFWARGDSRTGPPSALNLYVGKHVSEDISVIRNNETVGYVVLEAGSYALDGYLLEAGLGADSISGTDKLPATYMVGEAHSTAVLSAAAMDGTDGGWPVLAGPAAVFNGQLSLSFEEDQISDDERAHTKEQAAYIALSIGYQPVVNASADQLNVAGDDIDILLVASHPLGEDLGWSASGLPSGLSINPSTGRITGLVSGGGNYPVSVSVTATSGSNTTIGFTWTVINAAADINKLYSAVATEVSDDWQLISLPHSYSDMVVVATPSYDSGDFPAISRIRNAGGNSFELRVQSPSGNALSAYSVHYIVVEAGLYQPQVHGITMEAHNVDSSVADSSSSWLAEQRSYINNYQNPVVLGQVMSFNDVRWSVFWARGASKATPPSTDFLYVGRHIGADTNTARETERIAYLVVEAGQGTIGDIAWQAAVGSDIVEGITASSAPYQYTTQIPFTTAVLSAAAMDGGDGGWPVLLTIQADQLVMAFDEDTIGDAERDHTTEQVAWFAFGHNENPSAKQANQSVTFAAPLGSESDLDYNWNFGDGTPETGYTTLTKVQHTFNAPGRYLVSLTIRNGSGETDIHHYVQAIHNPLMTLQPKSSSSIYLQGTIAGHWVWNVNPDNNTVSAFDTGTLEKIGEIPVSAEPRSLTGTGDNGWILVVGKENATLEIISPISLQIVATINLPANSRPHGVVYHNLLVYIALEATGELLEINPYTGQETRRIFLGQNIRHISIDPNSQRIYVSRFISPAVMNEGSANPITEFAGVQFGGEVFVVDVTSMSLLDTVVLQHSDLPDAANAGRGIPNYLGPAVVSPDGLSAWVPSKQDNIKRGLLRDGQNLDHDNTVRSVSSVIDLLSMTEQLGARVDHDDAGIASNAIFGPNGNYLYVALEGSRDIAMLDVFSGSEVVRIDAGSAPQGVAVSADGLTLFTHNFMDRSITVHDLKPVVQANDGIVPLLATLDAVENEQLAPEILLGKQLFYDAADPRLALQRYISCAACHNAGGQDGRVWDLSGFGEGLRNTISLEGHGGLAHGPLHWSANFDEVQDFEGQIRALSSGFGLMDDTDFHTGTRSQPLGDPKAGLSGELDALAAYVGSLATIPASPARNADGSQTAAADAGEIVFASEGCASCHSGAIFTDSAPGVMHDVGTIKTSSGARLGGDLTGLDTPTLLGIWNTAPYLHDGSAPTIEDSVQAHSGVSLSAGDMANLVEYLRQLQ